MTIRETAIEKLQKLPDSLLQQVSDFIDFLIYRHRKTTTVDTQENTLAEEWEIWFEAVDHLPIKSFEDIDDCQQHLL